MIGQTLPNPSSTTSEKPGQTCCRNLFTADSIIFVDDRGIIECKVSGEGHGIVLRELWDIELHASDHMRVSRSCYTEPWRAATALVYMFQPHSSQFPVSSTWLLRPVI
jgi:hypothetical protein